ncbi:Retrovirus-related Pol polyprotein from transposon opus [Exaiptasia diaphana]|nr:Retrovirus-related Pol polyprotein from transposon opus [Exaiptasia diaphana]
MRSLAVIPVATCVLRTELLQLHQKWDEAFRALSAQVRGKAETYSYSATCECGKTLDYTDNTKSDVLLSGIYDSDIRREILGMMNILDKPVNDVIALVEAKEVVRTSYPQQTYRHSQPLNGSKRHRQPPKTHPLPTAHSSDTKACDIQATTTAIADTGAKSDLWPLEEFLTCGFSHDDLQTVSLSVSAARHANDGCTGSHNSQDSTCTCPQCEAPPPHPRELPFPCTPDNNKRMETWLLERYTSSTFNTCPHRALPCMDGPPVEIHVDPPATIRLHWQLHKHCDCQSGIPDCCPGRWKITLAGSRFLSPAKQRYAAVEGEAIAIACGQEQTRYFTQGCDNLAMVTGHKPLVKILGDRTLDEISNSGLFRLKQLTLPWRFDIEHRPGKTNIAADATSRHPSPSSSGVDLSIGPQSKHDIAESTPFGKIFADFTDYGGHHYLIVGDRLSSWVEVLSSTAGTDLGGSKGLICHLRAFFATFVIPEELSSDGGPEFMSSVTERQLHPLATGDREFLQNQRGPHPNKWDRSGLVVESAGNDQYRVKIDGSGRLTLRYCCLLRAYTPIATFSKQQLDNATHPPLYHQQPSLPLIENSVPRPSQGAIDQISEGNTNYTATLSTPPATTTSESDNQNIPVNSQPEETTNNSNIAVPETYPTQLQSQKLPQGRPTRVRRTPKHFKPETGTWKDS